MNEAGPLDHVRHQALYVLPSQTNSGTQYQDVKV